MSAEDHPTMPASERPDARFSDPHTFCNCGKTGCPSIESHGDGVAVSDPDVAGGAAITFDADQARELRLWLEQRGF